MKYVLSLLTILGIMCSARMLDAKNNVTYYTREPMKHEKSMKSERPIYKKTKVTEAAVLEGEDPENPDMIFLFQEDEYGKTHVIGTKDKRTGKVTYQKKESAKGQKKGNR